MFYDPQSELIRIFASLELDIWPLMYYMNVFRLTWDYIVI